MAKGWKKPKTKIVQNNDIDEYPEGIDFESINFEDLEPVSSNVLAQGFKNDDKSLALCINDNQYQLYEVDVTTKEEICTTVTKEEALQAIKDYQLDLTEIGVKELGNNPLPSPVQSQSFEEVAVNTEGQEMKVSQSIDFNKIMLERYGVTEKDCYTVHPEQDVLEEIFKRISAVEISFASMTLEQFAEMEKQGDCILYASTDEQQSDVDLRVINLDENINVSVPLTENEINQAREKVSELEQFLEAGFEDIDLKEPAVPKKNEIEKE